MKASGLEEGDVVREPVVCGCPGGSLWLLLEDDAPQRRRSRWLQLETGATREMSRCLRDLLFYGWWVIAGQEFVERSSVVAGLRRA